MPAAAAQLRSTESLQSAEHASDRCKAILEKGAYLVTFCLEQ